MRALAIIAALLLSDTAQAQDRMDRVTCEGSVAALVGMADVDASGAQTSVDDDGWCRTSGLLLGQTGPSRLLVGTLRWRGTGIARFIDEGLPPSAFEAEARDMAMVFDTGDPVLDYALGVQNGQLPYFAAAKLRWDALQKALVVENLSLAFSETNSLTFSGRIDRIDLTDAATLQTSLGTMGLTSLKADLRFDGWFQSFVLLPVAQMVLTDGPPEPAEQVAGLKQVALTFMAALPSSILPDTSEEALGRFLGTLPTPKGRLRLDLSSAEPIGATRLTPFLFTGSNASDLNIVTTILEGATLIATWEPMP